MLTALKSSILGLTSGSGSGSGSSNRRRTAVDTSTSYPGVTDHDDGDDSFQNQTQHQQHHPYGGARSPGLGIGVSSPYGQSSRGQGHINAAAAVGASVPRVKHSLTRIKANVRKLNPELLDTLSYPAASKQIAELQRMLKDYVIPRDVLDAYAIHDGQDSFSVPHMGDNAENEGNTGFIYGLWWMSIDEVMEEYAFWRRLDVSNPPSPVAAKRKGGAHTASSLNNNIFSNNNIINDLKGKGRQQQQQQHQQDPRTSSSSEAYSKHTPRAPSQDAFLFGSEIDPRTVRSTMRSCPEGYVREEYSHPSWLPLLKDGYGNYIGIDLDPPILSADEKARLDSSSAPPILPARGQVIAFGREMDTKTVLWNGWGDSNAYDNLGGGGWARFLASFADDLSASSALHSNNNRRHNNNNNNHRQSQYGGGGGFSSQNDPDSDDEAYRFSTGGRQEGGPTDRSATGLEWIDASPAYSGMGTIEALVERSRRIWASLGMPMPIGTPASETVPLVGSPSAAQEAEGEGEGSVESSATMAAAMSPFPLMGPSQSGIDRSHKPPPLAIGLDAQQSSASASSAIAVGGGGASGSSPGRSISHPSSSSAADAANARTHTSGDGDLEDVDVSLPSSASAAQSQTALMHDGANASLSSITTAGDDSYTDGLADDPARSTTALVHPEFSQTQSGYRPPLSPEPSLILSPPSPKDNVEMFGPFPSSSSPPALSTAADATAGASLPRPETPLGDANGDVSAPVTPLASSSQPSSANRVASPTHLSGANSLHSPARMSPGQAQRFVDRHRQRTLSGNESRSSQTSQSVQAQAQAQAQGHHQPRRPPPPVMPLGLPTLEFGNGTWGEFDAGAGTGAYGYEKDSFEVVIDGPRN